MARIRLSSAASVVPTAVGVQLRSDLRTFLIDGRDVQILTRDILPLLDGSCDKEGVISALEQFSRSSVVAFLDLLEKQGLLETVSEDFDFQTAGQERLSGRREFFRKWTERPDEMAHRLSEARVLIVGLEPWGVVAATELAAAGVGKLHIIDETRSAVRNGRGEDGRKQRGKLLAAELSRSSECDVSEEALPLTEDHRLDLDGSAWDLVICAAAADELLLRQSVARFADQALIVSLSGYPDKLDAIIGPMVIPDRTACWNCSRLRLLANSAQPEAAHALQAALLAERPKPRRRAYLAPMSNLIGNLLTLEALKLLSGYAPPVLAGRLMVQDLVTLKTTFHQVIRMPWCEVCGGHGSASDSPRSVTTRDDGLVGEDGDPKSLDDVRDPDELRKLLQGWIDERTGVVKHLTGTPPDLSQLELLWTGTAIISAFTEGVYKPSHQRMGFGAGLSLTEAMIGAAAEAIEQYSAARYRRTDLLRSSLNHLTEDFLDPRRLCLYDQAQYNEEDFPYARFAPDLPIEWTKGRWLDNNESVWLPALLTYVAFEVSPEEYFCQVTSNGLAAGSSLEDATLRAVFELVERDALMITWLGCLPGQELIRDNTLDPGAGAVIRELEARGMEVRLYVLDVGIGIPTVLCLVLGDGKDWPGATVALAAHLSPQVAARKAVLEQGMIGPSIRRQMLDEKRRIPRRPEDVAGPTDHALYYVPRERASAFDFLGFGRESVPLAELAEPQTISLANCIERLNEAGIRVAIKDVTSPDVALASPFRVVRALSPLMQPIHFGFNLGRLANPRLKAMIKGRLNPNPQPLA